MVCTILAMLLFMVVAHLVVGCAPTKTLSSSETQTSEKTVIDVRSELHIEQYVEKYFNELLKQTESRNLEIRKFTYDTSLPVDSLTGRPPLKESVVVTDKSMIESSGSRESTGASSTVVDSTGVDKSVLQKDVIEATETVKKKGVSPFWWVVIGIGAAAITYTAYRLWKAFIKKV